MEHLINLALPGLREFLSLPVFPNGKHLLTLGMIIHVSVLLIILVYATTRLKRWLIERVLSKTSFEPGFRYTFGAVISYLILVLGFLIILDTAGIDTTAITVVAGALGLGISLSLQTIISNCFAGLFILLERKIRVGDKIQIGDLIGQVKDISLRASSLITSENTLVIIPNSDLISSRIINLSYDNKVVRVSVALTIAWMGDTELLIKILQKAAQSVPGILSDKPIEVLIRALNKGEQTLSVSVWTEDYANKKEVLQSELYAAIMQALKIQLDKITNAPA